MHGKWSVDWSEAFPESSNLTAQWLESGSLYLLHAVFTKDCTDQFVQQARIDHY
jgi:hypothetical protein